MWSAVINFFKAVSLIISLLKQGYELLEEYKEKERKKEQDDAAKKLKEAKSEEEEDEAFRDLIGTRSKRM